MTPRSDADQEGDVQTRRDQLQAHRFVTTRVQSALLHGEPDAAESPMRRISVSTFSSVMIAIVVLVGFGIFGLLRPGAKEGWKQPGTLVVEKETGTRFVYDETDDALHPVLNFASARLILNTPTVNVQLFSRKSLSAAHRGVPYGIANLPDSLPDPGGLVTGPWTICSQPASPVPTVTVSVAQGNAGTGLDPTSALLVRTGLKQFLIWNNTRLEIPNPQAALPALRFNATPLPVAASWVNSVPPGPDLKPIDVPNRGQPGVEVGGSSTVIGQVLKVPGEGSSAREQYWLVTSQGLATITETDALLLLGDPEEKRDAYNGRDPSAIQVPSVAVGQAQLTDPASTVGFPPSAPAPANPLPGGPQVVCAAYSDTSGETDAVVVTLADKAPGIRPQASADLGTGEMSSQVALPPGKAAVVRLLPHKGQQSSSTYLVTDAGGKYPVPSKEVLNVLGYGTVAPVPVPGGILDLIRTGPALDQSRAKTPVPVGGSSVGPPNSVPGGTGGG
ncbi:MAG TPA: type VII secretion protein EccB [Mycobacteriales bacterium]|nr:type VII secretion protein EccB [Mycobacteriales bacterium]